MPRRMAARQHDEGRQQRGREVPKLPTTWHTDFARVRACRRRPLSATREDSGWKTEEPVPMSGPRTAAAHLAVGKGEKQQPTRRETNTVASE